MKLSNVLSCAVLTNVAFATPVTRHYHRQAGPLELTVRVAIESWIDRVSIVNEFIDFAGFKVPLNQIPPKARQAAKLALGEAEDLEVLSKIEGLDQNALDAVNSLNSGFFNDVVSPLQSLANVEIRSEDEFEAAFLEIHKERCMKYLDDIQIVIQAAATSSGIADDRLNITVPRPKLACFWK